MTTQKAEGPRGGVGGGGRELLALAAIVKAKAEIKRALSAAP
jgi:hypothetical protein